MAITKSQYRAIKREIEKLQQELAHLLPDYRAKGYIANNFRIVQIKRRIHHLRAKTTGYGGS